MRSKKRFLTIFAAFVFSALIMLCSCSLVVINDGSGEDVSRESGAESIDTGDEDAPKDTEAADTTEKKEELKVSETEADKAKKRVEALMDFDFKKQSFIIATTSNMTFAVDGDSYYDRVLLMRDSMVEEKYNVDIITIYSDAGRISTDLRNAALSDDYFADMISVPAYRIGALASEGLIMNLRSLPFYSVSSQYSDSTVSAAGNGVYADVGAASADFSKIYGVFFNRDIAEKLGFNLDKMVSDGEWTWDSLDRISRRATEELGIIGQGSAAMGNEYTDVVLRSADIRLVDNTLGKPPVISFDSERLESVVEKMCALIYGNPSAYKPQKTATEADFYQLFASGQLLFAIAPLSEMWTFSTLPVSFGILPIPKYEESQSRYFSFTAATANLLAVPSENNKPEMTGVILGALNTASYKLLAEEYTTNCLYNYFRDAKALRSMDAVLDSISFDFSYIYASGTKHLADATYGAVRKARTSANDYATNIINSRLSEANAELARLFGEKTVVDPPASESEDIAEDLYETE